MSFNLENLQSLIAECVNWFKNKSPKKDKDYLLTQKLLNILRNQQLQQGDIQELQNFFTKF